MKFILLYLIMLLLELHLIFEFISEFTWRLHSFTASLSYLTLTNRLMYLKSI